MGRRFDQQRFETVIVNGEAGGFEDARRGFAERTLDRSGEQSSLQLVGERSLRQLQSGVQGMNAEVARATVGDTVNVDFTEDGFEGAPLLGGGG